MKHLLFLILIVNVTVFGQTQTENYIKTIKHKEPGNGFYRDISPDNTVEVDIIYYDGLGRPKQHIAHRQSGTGGDLVTHMEYDGLGRQVKQYLPFERNAHSSLPFDENAEFNTLAFYNTSYFQNTQNPYSQTAFENSPLNRVLKQAAPGNEWEMDSGKEIKMEYRTNNNGEVWHFMVNNPSSPSLELSSSNNGRYPAQQLYKTITKDENWESGNGSRGTVVEYKNKLGQVVLKRVYSTVTGRTNEPNTNLLLDTYYVYDDYGNLTFVLPPKLSMQIVSGSNLVGNHQQLLDELGYRYIYDYRNRLINKRLPGKQPELIAYDVLDRVVAVGPVPSPFMDSNQEGFIRTKYDHYNRVVYTLWRPGTFSESQRQAMEAPQTHLSETRTTQATVIDGISVFYTNYVSPNSSDKLLTVNYYDEYGFPGAPSSIPAEVGENNEIDVYYNNTIKPKGMPTGGWVRVLEGTTDQNATVSYTLYDIKSRPVRVHMTNYMGGFTQTDTEYDFIGKVVSTYTSHKKTSTSVVLEIKEDFEYNNQDRIEKHLHRVNSNNPEMLSFNEYDAMGQLVIKKVGGSSETTGNYFQKVDYKYNIRGWLTEINNVGSLTESGAPQDLFAFKINYTQVTNTVNGNVTPLYNGNIAETQWRTSSDNIKRRYGYSYDYTNRMLDAWYSIPGSAVADSYNEHLTYDENGNILSLMRNGDVEDANTVVEVDELTYTYDLGNKLLKVIDSTSHPSGFKENSSNPLDDDYDYDVYGNLISDQNKGITLISYNHLHLPKKITFNGGEGEITYLYTANGNKVSKTVTEGTTITNTHYLDGFQYVDDDLEFFPHAEGYVKHMLQDNGPLFNYVYNYTDHLGNIRLRYAQDPQTQALTILEEDHYYPFGLKHKGYESEHKIFEFEESSSTVVLIPITPDLTERYKYKFGGKELQSEFGIEMYDFGFRNYQPDLGRWFNIDPLAEKYYDNSSYVYTLNNPIVYIDPDGCEVVWGDNLSAEDKEIIGQAVYWLRKNSSSFNKMFEELHSSDMVFKVGDIGSSDASWGVFARPSDKMIGGDEMEDGTFSDISFQYDMSSGAYGGFIGVNLTYYKELKNEGLSINPFEETVNTLPEEFAGAALFLHYYSQTGGNSNGTPASGNIEFETKMISGIVKNESGLNYGRGESQIYAESFGVKYRKQNTSDSKYFNYLQSWHQNPKTDKFYRRLDVNDNPPEYVKKL